MSVWGSISAAKPDRPVSPCLPEDGRELRIPARGTRKPLGMVQPALRSLDSPGPRAVISRGEAGGTRGAVLLRNATPRRKRPGFFLFRELTIWGFEGLAASAVQPTYGVSSRCRLESRHGSLERPRLLVREAAEEALRFVISRPTAPPMAWTAGSVPWLRPITRMATYPYRHHGKPGSLGEQEADRLEMVTGDVVVEMPH